MATTDRGIYYTTQAGNDDDIADLNVITKAIADSTEAAIDALEGDLTAEVWTDVAAAGGTQPSAAAEKFKFRRRGSSVELAGYVTRTVDSWNAVLVTSAGNLPHPAAERRIVVLAVNNTSGAWSAIPCTIRTDGSLTVYPATTGNYAFYFDGCGYV